VEPLAPQAPDVVPDLSLDLAEDDFDGDVRTLVAGILNQVAQGRAPTAREGLSGADLSKVNFRNADLSGAFLDGCVLTNATLRNARMREVDLTAATMRWTDISGADLSRAVLRQANLNEVKARRTTLRGADLAYSTFVGGSLVRADLSRALVYGASVWDVDLTGAVQEHLIITRPSEPDVSVNDFKVAQSLHLIIANRHIRDVVDTLTTKVVLVLERFTGERKAVLDTAAAQRRSGFVPVLSDFERPASRDFTETVVTLADSSRFIVADLTDPASLPKELEAIVPHLAVPLLPLLQREHQPYAMFSDSRKYDWVLSISRYADAADLVRHFIVRVLRPVEQAVQELDARHALSGRR